VWILVCLLMYCVRVCVCVMWRYINTCIYVHNIYIYVCMYILWTKWLCVWLRQRISMHLYCLAFVPSGVFTGMNIHKHKA